MNEPYHRLSDKITAVVGAILTILFSATSWLYIQNNEIERQTLIEIKTELKKQNELVMELIKGKEILELRVRIMEDKCEQTRKRIEEIEKNGR